MTDTIITVLLIMVVCVVLPVLILWLRDRGGVLGFAINKAAGLVALLIGLAISGWVVYNLFSPTREFRQSYHSVLQFLVPVSLVYVGWKWLTDPGPGIEDTPSDAEEVADRDAERP